MSDAELRNRGLYEADLYLWTREQAQLLRERRFGELDLDNLVDEVESVGSSERRDLRKRMAILIAHLLKWKYQPGLRTPSWTRTIRDQREEIEEVLKGSPSLRPYPGEIFANAYRSGHLRAAEETGIDYMLFPETPPFTVEQALDDDFLPKEPDLHDQS